MKFKIWLLTILLYSASNLSAQLQYVNNDSSSFLKIMLVGDVSLSPEVLEASRNPKADSYDFQYVFHYIRPVLNLGDIVIGNIDNSFGQENDNYLESALMSVPDEYGVALKYAGFNFLMNANKSAVHQELDQWKANKKFLDDINIVQLGSFEHEEDRYKRNPTIVEKYGIKVAILNYIDGIPYYPEISPLVNGVKEDLIKRDIVLAKNRGADFTIVYMNWGNEYQSEPTARQISLADICLEEGADVVVGSHTHRVQNVLVRDDVTNGFMTKEITAYSLGDFVSVQSSPLNNSACILEIIIEKDKESGVAFVNDMGFIPTFTAMYEGNGEARYAIMPVSQVEKGNMNVPISVTEKQWMSGAAEKVRHKFSGELREVEYELNDEIIDDVAEVLTVTRRPLNEDKDFKLGINNHLLLALSGFNEDQPEISSTPIVNEGIVYKVQFLSLRREIPIDLDYYKHLKGYQTYKEDEYYHYVIGNYKNLKLANDFCLDVKRNGHKYAYVVAFENGVKITK